MKLFDFFGGIFKTGTIPESSYNFDELFADYQNLYLKNLAIDKSAEFLARIFSNSDFKFLNSDKKTWSYMLNVKPNKNESASRFWQRFIYKLITENEVLVVLSDDDQLLIADSFDHIEYAVYEDLFQQVTIKDYTFKRTFKMNEVIYLQYNNNRLSNYIDGLFTDYEKLHQRMIETIQRNNQIRGTLGVKGSAQLQDKYTNLMKSYADRLFSAFSTKSVAIVPTVDGLEYNELTNTTGTSNISVDDVKTIRRQFDDEIADILGIPAVVLHGDMATLDSSQKALVIYCMKPLFKKVNDELNAKLISKTDFEKGIEISIIGLAYQDIIESATSIDKLIASSAFTKNEVRNKFGYESVEGGDKFIMTKNYIEEVKGGENLNDTNTD
ncbi:phage portal protein [Streptococcus uberis]|uniref:phage portal protein n=1 Tax=Streptococcus uberis TaxID=1349 RepID=UPI0027DD725F|nr:phage portal protein [Streptococcus uberis]MCK1200313.1 phage portal protein [Streptococcus uberis]